MLGSPSDEAVVNRRAIAVSVGLAAAVAGAAPATAAPENEFEREGVMVSVSVGPGGFFGFGGLDEFRGGGGVFCLRLGTTASESLLWMIELDSGTFVDKLGELGDLSNIHSVLVLGGQYYIREVVWLRLGWGIATFQQRQPAEMMGEPPVQEVKEAGIGSVAGIGYDLFRRGIFAFDLELTITTAAYEDAFMGHFGVSVAANWY